MVFPEGEAENLVTTHDSYIKEALIQLQTHVHCLRSNNVNFYDKDEVQEWCNTDFRLIERGVVQAVYAFKPGTECKRFFYRPTTVGFVSAWMDAQACVSCDDYTGGLVIDRSPYCHDMVYGDFACENGYEEATESDCSFRNGSRYYAIGPGNKLYLAPRFPCDYKVAVHWEGIKRDWSNSDPITDDHDLVATVAKYLEAQRAMRLDKDLPLYERLMQSFAMSQALMMVRCTRERRTQENHESIFGSEVLRPFFFDPPTAQSGTEVKSQAY